MTVLQPTTAKHNPWRHLIPVAIIVLLTIILFILTPPCFAQGNGDPSQSATPPPASTPSPPSPPWEAGQPSAQMVTLMNLVRELVPYMRRQIEKPLLEKFSFLAMILASIVLLFSFIRTIRENDGASSELYYWFGRAVFCMALFAIAPAAISTLYKIGRTLTIPIEPMIEEKRTAFNDQYYAFVQGHFIIKDEKNVFIQPAYIEPGEYGWVGILTDHESGDGKLNGLKAMEGATDMTSWSMPKLFFGLNLARGILQAGEIFLLVLSGFIMIGLRLAVPFMVAVAVDKKLAERISYPFIWGTVVFTMIFPVVRDTLTFIAYTVGSFGLSLYDGAAPYTIDERTSQIIKNNAYDPTLIIIVTLCIMLINGMMLWLSPYLAYRIATGQLFEAVSSTASGWMAAIIGSAVEFTGLKTGAALQRQAENTQTQGGYQAEMTRAKGSLDASNLGANARQISGHANIEGNRQATLWQSLAELKQRAGWPNQVLTSRSPPRTHRLPIRIVKCGLAPTKPTPRQASHKGQSRSALPAKQGLASRKSGAAQAPRSPMPALALSIPYSGTLPWATEPATSTELTTSFPPTPYRTKQPPRTPYKKVSSPIRATWKPPPRHSSMATYRPSMPEPEPPPAALTVAQLYPKPESIRRTPLKCKPTRFSSAVLQLPPAKSKTRISRPPISAKSQPLSAA